MSEAPSLGTTVFLSVWTSVESDARRRVDLAGILCGDSPPACCVAVPGQASDLLDSSTPLQVASHSGDGTVPVVLLRVPRSSLVVTKPARWTRHFQFGSTAGSRPSLQALFRLATQEGWLDMTQHSEDSEAQVQRLQARVAALEAQAESSESGDGDGHPTLPPGFGLLGNMLGTSAPPLAATSASALGNPSVQSPAMASVPSPGDAQLLELLRRQFTQSNPLVSAGLAPPQPSVPPPPLIAPGGGPSATYLPQGFAPHVHQPHLPPGPQATSSQLPNSPDLLQLLLLTELRRLGGDQGVTTSSNVIARAFANMETMRSERVDSPESIINPFLREVWDQLGVRTPHQHWQFREHWESQNYTRCRSVGRCAYILAEVVQALYDNQPRVALATAVAGWQGCHQFALDQGSWRAAWPLVRLRDPYARAPFAGSARDLSTVGGFLRAQHDLQDRIGPQTMADLPEDQTEGGTPASPAPKRRQRRGALPKKKDGE